MDEHKAKTEKIAGIVMLIISVMSFGAVDGFSKMLVDTQSFGQIMLTRYLPSFLAVLLVAGPGGWKGLFATRSPSMQILRGLTPILVGGPQRFQCSLGDHLQGGGSSQRHRRDHIPAAGASATTQAAVPGRCQDDLLWIIGFIGTELAGPRIE